MTHRSILYAEYHFSNTTKPPALLPSTRNEPPPTILPDIRPLADALIFIRRNISTNLTASDVYAAVGKSHTLVDSAFRKTFGTSVQKTIISTRLEEAKRLIRDTSLTLTEIAAKTGYSTAQYFCSSFSKAFGISPSAFRMKM